METDIRGDKDRSSLMVDSLMQVVVVQGDVEGRNGRPGQRRIGAA